MQFIKLFAITVATATTALAATLPVDSHALTAARDLASIPRAPVTAFKARQLSPLDPADALITVEEVLNTARREKSQEYRGRKLSEGSCSANCEQCKEGAVTKALAEVGLCGTAALALEVASAGTLTILEVSGFVLCEVAIVGELNESLANCKALTRREIM